MASRDERWEKTGGGGTAMIHFDEEKQMFWLDMPETSYCMMIADGAYLAHVYYGQRIRHTDLTYLLRLHDDILVPSECPEEKTGFFDKLPQEYPTNGRGDYREPCLALRGASGQIFPELTLKEWTIREEKRPLPGLPSTYGDHGQTLELALEDAVFGLAVTLCYTVYDDADVVIRSLRIRNEADAPLFLTRVLSACLELPDGSGQTLTFGGAWAREHIPVWREAGYGGTVSESLRGAPGHGGQPFIGFRYDNGSIYAMHLIYSGGYLAKLQQDAFGDYRMVLGIHPETFEWKLEPGECFYAPEAVLVYSPEGTSGMTRILHDFYRSHLIRDVKKPRPILINNWEATYFDFDEERILSIAREAAKLGVELFVLDDGWFGEGRMEPSGDLGDWTASERKLPRGLKGLSEALLKLGLQLGLWFEPEMVSKDSKLFRTHPDWVLHQEGRTPALCRDQWMLDLSNPDVLDYLFSGIAAAVREGHVRYLKWDMNRTITDAGSSYLPPDRQGEIFHRHVLGVYELQERLLHAFPELLIENCASGGARFDPGMLYYSPQIWCSDDMDVVERMKIHEGTAMLYPLSVIGSHVAKSPNDISGRYASFEARGISAMFGSFGYELDITALPEEERKMIPGQIARYKELRELIREGDYYNLLSLAENGRVQVYEVVSKDGADGFLVFQQVLSQPNGRRMPVCLRGLLPERSYILGGGQYFGEALMKAGYLMPYVRQDFYAEIIEFHAVPLT